MILPVITIGHETLKRRAFEVAVISDAKIQTLIDDMIPTMFEKDGIGLAANQVNALHRIAVIVPDPHRFDAYKKKQSEALVVINPVITKHSLLKETGEECCLSVPGVMGLVKRWKWVTVTYLDRTGTPTTLRTSGLLAKVFQHEIDHLDGILFVERSKKLFKLAAPSAEEKTHVPEL